MAVPCSGDAQNRKRVGPVNVWQELPRVTVLVMELTWIVPWFQLITLAVKDTSNLQIGITFGLIALLAYLLARTLAWLVIKEKIRKLVSLGYILIASLLSMWFILYRHSQVTDLWVVYNKPLSEMTDFRELIPPEVMVVLAVLWLTRRGYQLAHDWAGTNTLVNNIQTGIILLVIYGLVAKTDTELVIALNLLVFLIAAILGMLTARIGSIVGQRGGRVVRFDLGWFGSILFTTVMITGAAAAVAVISANQLDNLNEIIKLIFYTMFLFVATPFFTIMSRIFPAFDAIRQSMQTPSLEGSVPNWELDTTKLQLDGEINGLAAPAMEFFLQLRFIILFIIIVAATIIVIRMIRRWQLGDMEGSDDERQSLLEGSSLLRLILDAIRSRIIHTTDSLIESTRLDRREQAKAAARIRRIYAELMELCETLGQPRMRSQTPQEFLPAVVGLFPQQDNELDLITNCYQRIRYGELPETHQEVLAVEQAWKSVSEEAKSLKKQRQNPERS